MRTSGTLQAGVRVASLAYDGLGRRTVKAISHSGPMDSTHHFYYDAQRLLETRNGSDQVLGQQVWGLAYVDELIAVGINQDPWNASSCASGGVLENRCERWFLAAQDANYNVLGLVTTRGVLAERYELENNTDTPPPTLKDWRGHTVGTAYARKFSADFANWQENLARDCLALSVPAYKTLLPRLPVRVGVPKNPNIGDRIPGRFNPPPTGRTEKFRTSGS